MRVLAVLLLAGLLLAPSALAAIPTTSQAPALRADPDVAVYRTQVDRAVQYALQFQKADGGIYSHYEFLRDYEASLALLLLARADTVDARGPALANLISFVERMQRLDGGWGSSASGPITTAYTVRGLLEAGYDVNSSVIQRALTHIRLTQAVDGSWTDGGQKASHQTAQYVEILLRTGTPRDDVRIQQAMQFILLNRDPATGGFSPTPGFRTTEGATGDVLLGLDAYLRAPAGKNELVSAAEVQAAANGALAYLDATLDRNTGLWMWLIGANALIAGSAIDYHVARGLPIPSWLQLAVRTLLDYQAPNGGLYNMGKTTTVPDWTYQAFAGLAGAPRALKGSDSVKVQVTHNAQGTYTDATVTLTLRDGTGAVKATKVTPTGFTTLSWSGLSPGRYVLRAEAPGAAAFERVLWVS